MHAPALRPVAPELGAGEAELVAQRHRERLVLRDIHAALLAVDVEGDEPLHRALRGQHRREHPAAAEQIPRHGSGGAGGDNPLDELAAGEAASSRLNGFGLQHLALHLTPEERAGL